MNSEFVSTQCPECDEWTTFDRLSYDWTDAAGGATDVPGTRIIEYEALERVRTTVTCPFCDESYDVDWGGESTR